MAYQKIIHDGDKINIVIQTRHEFLCEKLGRPVETPEAEIEAEWQAIEIQANELELLRGNRNKARQEAKKRLRRFNKDLIANMDNHAAIIALAAAISDIRDILNIEEPEGEQDE